MAELSPDLQLIAERELGETQQVKKEAVARLRTLLAGTSALYNYKNHLLNEAATAC